MYCYDSVNNIVHHVIQELQELNQVVGGARPGAGAKRQLDPLLCNSPAVTGTKKMVRVTAPHSTWSRYIA